MIVTLLDIVHIFVCVFLMFVVLLQQGKGGGMGAAFGGGATAQVFGGRGAGNILTRATAVCAGIFMLTSVSLAYFSSSGDRDLRARIVEEQRKGKGNEGTRVKSAKTKPAAAPETAPAAPSEPPSGAPAGGDNGNAGTPGSDNGSGSGTGTGGK
jgi:preprotein translocase subunit SecG